MTWGGGATADVVRAGGQTGPHQIVLREVEVYNRASGPVIQMPPWSQAVDLGDDVTLSVAATGDNLQYQWLFNGTAMSGVTGATLALSDVALAQQGVYTVMVGNAAGSVTSPAADLTVVLSFQDWLDLYFGGSNFHTRAASVSPSGPEADPNGDGIPNLLEYVFGTNPGRDQVGG